MEASDRKKAKQAYLESLQRQKTAVQNGEAIVSSIPTEPSHEAAPLVDKQSKRERLLEEKRKAFFQQQQEQEQRPAVEAAEPTKALHDHLFAPVPGSRPHVPAPAPAPAPALANVSAAPHTRVDSEQVRLSDWKRLGYPSEYSYAKFLGVLDGNKPPLASSTSTSATQGNHGSAPPPPELSVPNSFSSYEAPRGFGVPASSIETTIAPSAMSSMAPMSNNSDRETQPGLWGLPFSQPLDKEAKRKQQEDYARSLEQQMNGLQSNARGGSDAQRGGAAGSGVEGLQLGHVSSVDEKRAKQEQYATALRQQHQQQPQQSSLRGQQGVEEGMGFGHNVDRETKRRQQEEYARALQQDAQQPQQPYGRHGGVGGARGRDDTTGREHPHALGAPTVDYIGGRSEIDQRRAHQTHYADQLQQQLQQQRAHPPAMEAVDASHGGGLPFSQPLDKEAKRKQQEDYARSLEQQMNGLHSNARGGSDAQRGGAAGSGVEGLQLGHVSSVDEKRAKQEQYATALRQQQQQQQQHQQQPQQSSLRGQQGVEEGMGFGHNVNRETKRRQQEEYARALQQDAQQPQQPYGRQGGVGGARGREAIQLPVSSFAPPEPAPMSGHGLAGIGTEVDRDSRRRQQAEYARALQAQVEVKHAPHGSRTQNEDSLSHGVGPGAGAGAALDAGWTIGPLGLPVRKTIHTGRRDLQKAFNAGISPHPQSPTKAAVAMAPSSSSSPSFLAPASYPPDIDGHGLDPLDPPGGAGLLALGDLPAREAKARKTQQARLLEEQIAANRLRLEAEKKKEQEDDRKLELRLEKERQELEAGYERERKEKRRVAEEDRRRELDRQREAEQREKEEARRKEKLAEEEEDRRVEREREALRRREEEEMRRERAAAAAATAAAVPVAATAPMGSAKAAVQAAHLPHAEVGEAAMQWPQSIAPRGEEGAVLGRRKPGLWDDDYPADSHPTGQSVWENLHDPPPASAPRVATAGRPSRGVSRGQLWEAPPQANGQERGFDGFGLGFGGGSPDRVRESRDQKRKALLSPSDGLLRGAPPSSSSSSRAAQAPPSLSRRADSRPSSSSARPLSVSTSQGRTLQGQSRFLLPDGRIVEDGRWEEPRPPTGLAPTREVHHKVHKLLQAAQSNRQPVQAVDGLQAVRQSKDRLRSPRGEDCAVQTDPAGLSSRRPASQPVLPPPSEEVPGEGDSDRLGEYEEAVEEGGFDIERELRKSRRKWNLLQRLNGIHNAVAMDAQTLFAWENEGPGEAVPTAAGLESRLSSRPNTAEWEEDRPPSARGALGRAGQFSMRLSTENTRPDTSQSDVYSKFGL